MEKNAIKKYAVWARRELIDRVSTKAEQYEISIDADPQTDSVHGIVLTKDEKRQRAKLISEVKEKGFEQVMDEVAYTWFNRFSALRFMEVNNYLPSRVRMFTDADGAFKPQILTEAIHMELPGLDVEKVYALKDANDDEALFKYLIITQCNALSAVLPGMFQKISDYTELLFPDNLLRDGSVIEKMVTQGKPDSIPEEDWKDQIQIIGWLYQYYNTEPKDQVFADLKKNVKITKEKIPAATQLFTPDWIVRYMVENSLGRLWIEGHPNEELKANWKYYLDEAKQEPEVEEQLAEIRNEYSALTPEQIRCIDPCSGSGHICAYLFDVLVQIYEAYGYTPRVAVESIIKNNLYGLDIDERAAQLAYFSVMMKAVQYDPRFLRRKDENGEPNIPQPHVYSIKESNHLDKAMVEYFVGGDAKLTGAMNTLIDELHDAKEYGAILNVSQVDFAALYNRFDEVDKEITIYRESVKNELLPFVLCAEAMAQKYHAVATNPPYMGASGMGVKLSQYLKKNYPYSKSDMSTVSMERCLNLCTSNGYMTMINIPVWMFLSSYEKLRGHLLTENTLINMLHPGRGIFGSDFGTTTFVFRKGYIPSYVGSYRRLFDKQGEVESIEQREQRFFEGRGKFTARQNNFSKIPGNPVAYWVSDNFFNMFNNPPLRDVAFAGIGMRTGDNERFLRFWFEISQKKFFPHCESAEDALRKNVKWVPYNKGGDFRRWYGNNEYVVNWENDGFEIKENTRKVYPQLGENLGWKISNEKYYFMEGITWTVVSSKYTSFRRYPKGAIISNSGQSVIANTPELTDYLTGLLNTKIVMDVLAILSPTIGFESGYINKIPIVDEKKQRNTVIGIVQSNVKYSKQDWDAFETSWDFREHPFYTSARWVSRNGEWITVREAYEDWASVAEGRFNQLKANEEELNRIFIDIYGLQDELTPEVEDKDVSVRKADMQRDVKSFISYAVGCMFGRYSLNVPGLVLAGEKFEDKFVYASVPLAGTGVTGSPSSFTYTQGDCYLKQRDNDGHLIRCTFAPDVDNVIPICDDEYFEDDIVNRFFSSYSRVSSA